MQLIILLVSTVAVIAIATTAKSWNFPPHHLAHLTAKERVQALHDYRFQNQELKCSEVAQEWKPYACSPRATTLREAERDDPYRDQDESRWNWEDGFIRGS